MASPSGVSTLRPSIAAASSRQDFAATPSTISVQAPRSPVRQPEWHAFRSSSSGPGSGATPLAEGFDEVFHPGELEARNEGRNTDEGLPLPDQIVVNLRTCAALRGVAVPKQG